MVQAGEDGGPDQGGEVEAKEAEYVSIICGWWEGEANLRVPSTFLSPSMGRLRILKEEELLRVLEEKKEAR